MKKHNLQKEELEQFLEELEKQGMPKHCNECENFALCVKLDPEEICPWLKKYRQWQKKNSKFNLTLFMAIRRLGKIKIALRGFVSYLPNLERRLDIIFLKDSMELKKLQTYRQTKKRKGRIKRR